MKIHPWALCAWALPVSPRVNDARHDGSEVRSGRQDAPFQDKLDKAAEHTLILKLPVKKPT